MTTFDIRVGYLVIFVLPVIIYYLFKFRGRAFVIYVILSLAFTAGSIELLTGFEVYRILQFCELLIWGLTIYVMLITRKYEIPFWTYIAGFIFICIISYIINAVNFVQLLLCLRKYLLFVAVFLLFHNIQLSNMDMDNLLKFIVLLFVSQIMVNIARYPIVDQTEYYIGTISILGGSTTAIFALVGIAFSFSAYLYTRKVSYILLIFGFFIFSVIGLKRGHLIFLPLLLLLQYVMFIRLIQEYFLRRVIISSTIVSIIICSIIYGGFIMIPSLNPEGVTGGSFDPAYVINYIDKYLNPGVPLSGIEYSGRGEAPRAVFELLRNRGWEYLLLGFGPGDIIMSKFTLSSDVVGADYMIAAMKYGIGYGVNSGVLYTIMQIGFVGAVFYFLFVFKIFSLFLQHSFYDNDQPINKRIISLGLVGFLGIFIFDFFAYSQTTFQVIPIILPICFAYHYALKTDMIDRAKSMENI